MKQIKTTGGDLLPMNETETEVFHFGTWKEIQTDQDGEPYIMGGLGAVYLVPVMTISNKGNQSFNVGDKVKDLSGIEGVVIDAGVGATVRVAFAPDGKGNWRDLNPQQLTSVMEVVEKEDEKHTAGKIVVIDGTKLRATNSKGFCLIADCSVSSVLTQTEKEANAKRLRDCWNGWDALQEENRALKYLTDQMHLNMQYYMEYCQANGYVTPMDWIANQKHFK